MWRIIKNLGGHYRVSDTGEVESRRRGRHTTAWKPLQQKYAKGYFRVTLQTEFGQRSFGVHRLVAEAFHPNPNRLPQVNHKNGNKRDNRRENLEWVTASANLQHAYDTLGRIACRGEKHGRSKLSRNDVTRINHLLKTGETQESISRKFGVRQSAISKIKRGIRWNDKD